MIRIENREQDLKIIGFFYKKGYHFLGIETFDNYKKRKRKYPFVIQNPYNLSTKYLRYDDWYEMTGNDYLKNLRLKKLRKILT